MAFLSSLNISGSALTAEKLRMDIISQNISNASTTKTVGGGPYRRKMVVFRENAGNFSDALRNAKVDSAPAGVVVSNVVEDPSAFKTVYDPTNPEADADGNVRMPNVNTTQEMVDMISSTRSYEANVTVFNSMKETAMKALDIGR